MKVTLLVGAACFAGLACSMDDPCAPQASACGGDPTGLWTVMDSCRDPAYELPKPVTYFNQAQTMARQPPPEPSSSDWCSYLQYDPGAGITQFTFPHDTLSIATGTVEYDGIGTYAVKMSVVGKASVDISGQLPHAVRRHLPVWPPPIRRRRRRASARSRRISPTTR